MIGEREGVVVGKFLGLFNEYAISNVTTPFSNRLSVIVILRGHTLGLFVKEVPSRVEKTNRIAVASVIELTRNRKSMKDVCL